MKGVVFSHLILCSFYQLTQLLKKIPLSLRPATVLNLVPLSISQFLAQLGPKMLEPGPYLDLHGTMP